MTLTPKPEKILEVFYSYAGEDEALRNVLEKHLSMLKHQGLITGWYHRSISAGMESAKEIDIHLNMAQIILLLVSADFLKSDYCYGVEMQRAMERHDAGEARVIPVLLRPVDYTGAPFEKLEALPTNGKAVSRWRDRDEAFADIAKGLRKAIEECTHPLHIPSRFGAIRLASAKKSPLAQLWNIPYRRNPFFTGREEVLARLHKQLHKRKSVALTQAQAISGLGGIGKTQIAVEYAYRYRQDYQAVLWVNADSREALNSSFVAIASLLQLPEKDAQDQRLVVEAVRQWLALSPDWLLILDNADNFPIVEDFLPATGRGHVLITTRARSLGTMAQRVELDTMEPNEGALLLLRRAHILPPDVALARASTSDCSQAFRLVAELGGLPLALDQAGAYLEETSAGLSRYLDLYQAQRQVLLKRRSTIPTNHPEPVATTWSLSFQRVEQANPAAAELLRFCAFMHPDFIPEEFITMGAPDLGPVLDPVAHDPLLLDEAIGELQRYSLVRRHPDTKTLSIHRLVQAVLKDEMNEQTQHQWAELVVRAVNRGYPWVEMATWSKCQRYLPHALVCVSFIDQWHLASAEAARLCHQAGNYLMDRAQYADAEPLYRRALTIKEQVMGLDHPDTAMTFNNLANLYTNQGQFKQVELLYQRAQDIYEQALGPNHPETASTLNNLANLYTNRAQYKQAESLLQRALKIKEQALGPNHPETASTLNNLANLYIEQWKYDQAEPLLQRALAIYEKAVGPEHPSTAMTLNNLANLYADQGKQKKAEPLLQRALAIYEKAVGPEHPSTAMTLNNLANLYIYSGQREEAELLLQRSLAIYEKALGSNHPDTAMALNNLALLYYDQHKYEQAEPLYQRALAIYEQVLPDHPDTVCTLNNLALLYYDQYTYEQAEPLYQRALAICERTLPDHPNTVITLNRLALLYNNQGKYKQAEPLWERALAICERTLPDHFVTRITAERLRSLYYRLDKREQAEPLFKYGLLVESIRSNLFPAVRILKNYRHLLQQMDLGVLHYKIEEQNEV